MLRLSCQRRETGMCSMKCKAKWTGQHQLLHSRPLRLTWIHHHRSRRRLNRRPTHHMWHRLRQEYRRCQVNQRWSIRSAFRLEMPSCVRRLHPVASTLGYHRLNRRLLYGSRPIIPLVPMPPNARCMFSTRVFAAGISLT